MHHSGASLADSLVRRYRFTSKGELTNVSCGARILEVERAPTRPPIVFADFERGNYANWTVEGEGFGKAPAAGTLPGQQQVSGYRGNGLLGVQS